MTTDKDLSTPLVPWLRPGTWGADRFEIWIGQDIRLLRGHYALDLVIRIVVMTPGRNDVWFNWSVRAQSANYIRLEKLWGKNLTSWPGRHVYLERRRHHRGEWFAVEGARQHRGGERG